MTSDTPDGPKSGKIVVGVDESEHARSAALWAAAEADRHGQPLRIVLGADLDRLMRFATYEAIDHLRETGRVLLLETTAVIQQRFPHLTMTREFSSKEPVSALHTSTGPGDTIVIGSRGRGGFRELMLGSVSLGVATGSAVPVIVVRGESERPETAVVTAAVAGPADADWLVRAAQEAQVRKASLRLLSVRKRLPHLGSAAPTPDDDPEIVRRREDLEGALASRVRADFPGLDITTDVVAGRSTAAVLVEASRHADVLIMGAHRSLTGSSAGLGRVPHALLHHSHCPVAIMPRRSRDEED
ncbi:universal stress protein [Streptomyces sp. NPDC101393]|uniref:universal stress protein n=1 Tax=Streptomyces sp. NPDC101393 TaxID=3366141 RepID=UPI0038022365